MDEDEREGNKSSEEDDEEEEEVDDEAVESDNNFDDVEFEDVFPSAPTVGPYKPSYAPTSDSLGPAQDITETRLSPTPDQDMQGTGMASSAPGPAPDNAQQTPRVIASERTVPQTATAGGSQTTPARSRGSSGSIMWAQSRPPQVPDSEAASTPRHASQITPAIGQGRRGSVYTAGPRTASPQAPTPRPSQPPPQAIRASERAIPSPKRARQLRHGRVGMADDLPDVREGIDPDDESGEAPTAAPDEQAGKKKSRWKGQGQGQGQASAADDANDALATEPAELGDEQDVSFFLDPGRVDHAETERLQAEAHAVHTAQAETPARRQDEAGQRQAERARRDRGEEEAAAALRRSHVEGAALGFGVGSSCRNLVEIEVDEPMTTPDADDREAAQGGRSGGSTTRNEAQGSQDGADGASPPQSLRGLGISIPSAVGERPPPPPLGPALGSGEGRYGIFGHRMARREGAAVGGPYVVAM
ncbi:hypothetical protein BJ875DRAFT_437126 [Amylocarpus encephaloides]|uniref:Uncharacterized protein n=1 Tax=Amylocarpus encephaloides TaxID=45428 RepID=A0A9P7YS41_9HELO|nr:hypothetical protein BJ875DRAFT_437126 [Amylocarpus encephaloides]